MTDAPTPQARDPRVPPLSLVLGFGPVALLPLLGAGAWLLPLQEQWVAVALAQVWGGAILLFLAGVRRGLSFFTPDGPAPAQLVTAIWLFVLGLAALALPSTLAFPALLVGYGTVAIADPRAARRGEVPAHFARLRPLQMAVAMAGLAALAVRVGGG